MSEWGTMGVEKQTLVSWVLPKLASLVVWLTCAMLLALAF